MPARELPTDKTDETPLRETFREGYRAPSSSEKVRAWEKSAQPLPIDHERSISSEANLLLGSRPLE